MGRYTRKSKQVSKTENNIQSGVLTCQEIEEFGLVNPINKTKDDNNSLQLTTYDLRLGEFHYVSSDKNWIPTYIGNGTDAIYNMIKDQPTFFADEAKLKTPGNVLIIPPYGKALVQLMETVDTASVAEKGFMVVGHFDLKLSKVQKGLISQQATQVEPYYRGKLFCYLFNLSGQEIRLKYAERIASIEFLYVSNKNGIDNTEWQRAKSEFLQSSRHKYDQKIGCDELGILNALYFAYNKEGARGLPDGVGLNELHSELKTNINQVENLKQKIETQINNCEAVKKEADQAIQSAKDFIKQNDQKKEQKKSLGVAIAAIVISVILAILSMFITIAVNYGWFDS